MSDSMQTTTYHFDKVVLSDKYGVDTYNANLDKIDIAISTVNTKVTTTNSNLTTTNSNLTALTTTVNNLPSWAKQPNKPTYTAAEVGAVPDTTTTMPNPHPLIITTSSDSYEYDGSSEVNITIAEGTSTFDTITVGETILTEADLIRLLALLNNQGDTVGDAVVGESTVQPE